MRWTWPWRRRMRRRPAHRGMPYGRIPDYDTVFPPDHPRHRPDWSDLIRPAPDPLDAPTQVLPTYSRRLMTLGGLWRAGGLR